MFRRFVPLWGLSVWLTACAGGGGARRDALRLDTYTVHQTEQAALLARQIASPAATSILVKTAPVVLGLMQRAHTADELEERLTQCAAQAEREGNALSFKGRPPTRQECGEVVAHDRCNNPITRAMQLGIQKHVLALQCAEDVLKELWNAPYSIEQRYRVYQDARLTEAISPEKEARLIAQGCTEDLRGTIKPDLVLHKDYQSLLKSVITLDFKFPCPDTNRAHWNPYHEGSPHFGRSQKTIYEEALGGETFLISPQGVTR